MQILLIFFVFLIFMHTKTLIYLYRNKEFLNSLLGKEAKRERVIGTLILIVICYITGVILKWTLIQI